jgi:hypothetical protein
MEQVLGKSSTVSLLDVLSAAGFLHWSHVEQWRRGNPAYEHILEHVQCGAPKLRQIVGLFLEEVASRRLTAVEAAPTRRTPTGMVPLKYTADGDPVVAALYNRHYARAGLTDKQLARTREKVEKVEDLVVLVAVARDILCSECGGSVSPGEFLTMEGSQPLCLACADMDHLEFLPSGNVALTRRAKKYSPLSAVVLRFNRSRKRYERQGLLVTPDALARADEECLADDGERAARRQAAATARSAADKDFASMFADTIRSLFPACPVEAATTIATHASVRGSGRVGRSAAGQALDPHAVRAAVVAHIRHVHTEYDALLMQGVERRAARDRIQARVQEVVDAWSRE